MFGTTANKLQASVQVRSAKQATFSLVVAFLHEGNETLNLTLTQ